MATTPRVRTRPSLSPVYLSVAEQVSRVGTLSRSHFGSNRWRLALEESRSDLASVPTLREARKEIYSLPDKQVLPTGSGAHLASLVVAVQEKVTAQATRACSSEGP